MKKKNLLLLFILITTVCLQTFAQTVVSEVLTTYSPSVVIKVQNVVSKVNLNQQEQLAIAELFKTEENEISEMIRNNQTGDAIDARKKFYHKQFNQTLSGAKVNTFYYETVTPDAIKEGLKMGSIAQQKYNCDNALSAILSDIYTNRKRNVDIAFLKFTDSTTLQNNLDSITKKYDSLICKYTHTASSVHYYEEQLKYLTTISPVSNTKQEKLNFKYLSLNTAQQNRSYADNFISAMNYALQDSTDTVYFARMYQDEIDKTSFSKATYSSAKLVKKNNVSKDAAEKIFPFIYQKEKKLKTIDLTFPANTSTKQKLIENTLSYYDGLIENQLLLDGSSTGKSQFSIALKYRASIGLNEDQAKKLLEKAVDLKKKKDEYLMANPEAKYDSKVYECKEIKGILNEDQYTKVLTTKTWADAKNTSAQNWNEMVYRKIISIDSVDKEKTINEFTIYYAAKLSAYYRNADNPIVQRTNVKKIEETMMPVLLRKLMAARKYNNPTDGTGTYQW